MGDPRPRVTSGSRHSGVVSVLVMPAEAEGDQCPDGVPGMVAAGGMLAAALAGIALLVAACGGGGGNSSVTAQSTT